MAETPSVPPIPATVSSGRVTTSRRDRGTTNDSGVTATGSKELLRSRAVAGRMKKINPNTGMTIRTIRFVAVAAGIKHRIPKMNSAPIAILASAAVE